MNPIEITRLLVSVRDMHEADAAIAGGADIVDVKDPGKGSLGRAHTETWIRIANAMRSTSIPMTVALGELHEWCDTDNELSSFAPEIRLAKIGLALQGNRASHEWHSRFLALARRLPCPLIPVFYADQANADCPPFTQIVDAATMAKAPYVLIDTFIKDGRSFRDWVDLRTWHDMARYARQENVRLVVAGSLSASMIADDDFFGIARPAVIAVRGAVCQQQDRTSKVTIDGVTRIRAAVDRLNSSYVVGFTARS